MTGPLRLIAPDLLSSEVANALWVKAHRSRTLTPTEAHEVIRRYLASAIVDLRPSDQIATEALDIALELGHPVYDCLYVALARHEACQLVTADQRLQRAIHGTRFASLVVPL